MNKSILFFFMIFILLFSCKKSIQTAKKETVKSDKSIIVKHKTYAILKDASIKKTQNWVAYKNFNEFLKRFETTSPNEAFSNVTELKELTKALKDSIIIEDFKTPAFNARLNVLENEILRLSDMSIIPAIKGDEVNNQIDKIFLVFGSLNDKINTIYDQKNFDKEIDLNNFFKLDTIGESIKREEKEKIKSIPKKEKVFKDQPLEVKKRKQFFKIK
ncbi:hypothetical protein C7447_101700 [Tenacibaculum adriaticum]|uniref:Lipoprotein n=1 Tax=Tenacibaculum adriaticum TaxID=413713 RepID=A0A5S5DVT0_9FLAO|nr:hypothetical protein [Tenacibaculum adriaticum]TYQ00091.1 hypothetical protein C7447_101700 [Tenacibaculum adriaticum]